MAFHVCAKLKDSGEEVLVIECATREEAETVAGIEGCQMEAENVAEWIIREVRAA